MAATRTYFLGLCLFALSTLCYAGVLPEERADLLYHSYEGGGVTIDGPSVLVRKNVNEKYSVYGNYYVDMVTSASIDVLTTASAYTEERTEYSLGVDYLNDRTIMSLSYTNSSESDYVADTIGFTISQEFFGDLSTLTLGYAQGDDTVKQNGNDSFEESATRKRYSLGFSQIITPKFLVAATIENVVDEGFLNNPYRQVRFCNPAPSATPCANGFSFQSEIYPRTRNSNALALRGIYYIERFGSSVRVEYRDYSDNWDINSQNIELRYTHPIGDRILLEGRYRTYSQNEADFYSDLFPFQDAQNFLARDKELSQYSAEQLGIGLTYTFSSRNEFFNNSSINLFWDTMRFDYDNFSDLTQTGFAPGEEPNYSLEADVIRIYFSAYF